MVDKKNVEDIFALSSLQEGILFHYLKEHLSPHYFEQLSLSISGVIDLFLFEKAWNIVVQDNEMLRAIYRWDKLNAPVQIILKQHNVNFKSLDFSSSNEDKTEILEKLKEEDVSKGFDLTEVPFRLTLVKLSVDQFELIISNHHILYDGWSNGIILGEFFKTYDSLITGTPIQTNLKSKYKDFIQKTRGFDKKEHHEYWTNYLKGFDASTPLPFLKTGSENKKNAKLKLTLDNDLISGLDRFVSGNQVTLASVIYAAWSVLLAKCTNSQDVVFGTVVSGRTLNLDKLENSVGLFINTVPLRFRLSHDESIMSIIQQASDGIGNLQSFEHTPLVEIKKASELEAKEQLFNSLVVIENYPLDKLLDTVSSLKVDSYSVHEVTNYDLTLTVTADEQMEVEIDYNSSCFERNDISRLGAYFSTILAGIVEENTLLVKDIEYLSSEEKRQLVEVFNDTAVQYEKGKTVVDLFDKQVQKTPESIAVNFEGKALTYNELNQRSNELASYLINKCSVKANELVGIQIERSESIIISVLAVLKSGASFFPIDPSYPQNRIDFLIADSKCKLVLNEEELQKSDAFTNDQGVGYITPSINTNDIAYVIYTSGSTGTSKGVQITHEALYDYIETVIRFFGLTPSDRIIQQASISFDIAIEEIFPGLCIGAQLFIMKDGAKDLENLVNVIESNEITFLSTTPLVINELNKIPEKLKSIKTLISGGDELKGAYIDKLLNTASIYNTYGPTETTVCATYHKVSSVSESNIIGRPIPNHQVYVLNHDLELLPIGFVGEMYIAGAGLSVGYLNNPELTAEKFIPNSVSGEGLMYKSGDLACWLPDGTLEFKGRSDDQVKIRGYRIELGEIEAAIRLNQFVDKAVVIAKGIGSAKTLWAYYTSNSTNVDSVILKDDLAKSLPEYMIPLQFVKLDAFPLTSNGKLNKDALVELSPIQKEDYIAPSNENEKRLTQIFSDVLEVNADIIGIDDDFFELGGHSLKATTLVSKIHKEFDTKIGLAEIFKVSTVRALSECIESASNDSFDSIHQAEEKPYYALSSGQKRIYLLQHLDLEATGYNMPTILSLPNDVDKERLLFTFHELIKRHESLRTSFEIRNDEPVQIINADPEFDLPTITCKESELVNIFGKFIQPFDLSRGPLIRSFYVNVSDGTDCLFIDMHHIITDGVSLSILENEFWAIYHGKGLKALKLQYKDYSEWLNSVRKDKIQAQEAYWVNLLSGELPVLNLPYDYSRPAQRSYEGEQISFQLTSAQSQKLRSICKDQGVTLYMCLLSVVNIWLAKLSGNEDIIIGSPIAGRRHADLEDMIGMFVNTLTMRSAPNGDKTFNSFLGEVKAQTLLAYENQEYGFDDLVEKVNLKRDVSRNLIFDILFSLQNQNASNGTVQSQYNPTSSKFDLTIDAFETKNEISFSWIYSKALFKSETIERLFGYFATVIDEISLSVDKKISEISIVGASERDVLVENFNDTEAEYPKDKTLVELFEEQVSKTPHEVALVFKNASFSFSEINERSNQLAHYLKSRYAIVTNDIVGIHLERSERMIIAILAALKSGAAYLPISPDFPEGRVAYMIKDSKCKVVINDAELLGFQSQDEITLVENPEIVAKPDDLAYVIYTSGSTGQPKGCMLNHEGVVNRIDWMWKAYAFNSKDVILQKTTFTFDVSVWEIFMPLCWGTKMVICEKEDVASPKRILNLIQSHKVTCLHFVPSMLSAFIQEVFPKTGELNELESLKRVITSGEALSFNTVRQWYEHSDVVIHNLYGPTEASVDVTYYETSKNDKKIYIGKPIANTQIYILDNYRNLVPIGVTGEIHIGGIGVAQGYLNKPELTNEKFIESPFDLTERLYKTGDIGRWIPDGNIEYMGRIDDQVKIRGHRIELGEIESVLLSLDHIVDTVVVLKGNDADKYLTAYFTAKEELLDPMQLKKALSQKLPEYMIPTFFMQLESLPLTMNGKINRKELPEIEISKITTYQAPRNDTDQRLIEIWSEVLSVKKEEIGISSNFFVLGGHSLKATLTLSKIQKEFNVQIPMIEIFKSPDIRFISDYIEAYKSIQNKEENKTVKSTLRI